MRNYKYTLYVWLDKPNDFRLETDSLKEVIKNMWEYRKEQFQFTFIKSKDK